MSIIKCPVCQNQISTMAKFCPHCGTQLSSLETPANPAPQEPHYSQPVYPPQQQYTEPQPIAQPIAPTQPINTAIAETPAAQAQSQQPTAQPEPTPADTGKKSKKKGIIKACIFGCLGMAVIGTIAIAFMIYGFVSHNNEEQEKQDYIELKNNFSIDKAEEFLATYPDSKYRFDVNDKINLYKRIDEEWIKIKFSTKATDFINFRDRFPGSQYEDEINKKINELNGMSATSDAGTSGVNTATKNKVEDIVYRYLAALSDGNLTMLKEVCSSQAYTKSCQYATNSNTTQIIEYNFNTPVTIQTTPESNDKLYEANATITRTIEDENGNKSQKTLNFSATLNAAEKITTVTIKPID